MPNQAQRPTESASTKPVTRARAVLNWAYYHGPNVQRLATIAALAVGTLSVAAAAIKYVAS